MRHAVAREDHRVRVARERRRKMKSHLLNAVMAVCADDAPNSIKVIDDVVAYAEVSRGTFYKYFVSLDEAIAELGAMLAEEMTVSIWPIQSVLTDAREKTAIGSQIFMRRAMLDPHWGGFIARIGLLTPENTMIRRMMDDIREGIQAGVYDLPSVESGLDLLVGTKIEAIRRIIRNQDDVAETYPQVISTLILRGFGVAPKGAEKIARAMADRLDIVATDLFNNWVEYKNV